MDRSHCLPVREARRALSHNLVYHEAPPRIIRRTRNKELRTERYPECVPYLDAFNKGFGVTVVDRSKSVYRLSSVSLPYKCHSLRDVNYRWDLSTIRLYVCWNQ
jgi:hypothetical protein